jgi:hypothetical protein
MTSSPSPLAGHLLAASAAAYGVDLDGRYTPTPPWFETAGFLAPPTVVAGGVRAIDAALVGTTPDGVVVAFRGTLTDSKKLPTSVDWFQDLLAAPHPRDGFPGAVHTGFHRAWTRLADGVLAAVRAQLAPGGALYVTGHSKGASLASLGAWALREAGFPPTGVVTFAAAHVGDAAFAAAYDAVFEQVRYEHHLDLVPFVPPTAALSKPLSHIPILGRLFAAGTDWGYVPVGRLHYITEGGAIIGEEPGLDTLRVAQIAASAVRDEGAAVLSAHSLSGGYCRAVCPPVTTPGAG